MSYARRVSEQRTTPASPAAERPAGPPEPTPLDPPMVPFAVFGMVGWAIAGLVLLLARGWLSTHGHTNWLRICLAGFLLGIPGLLVMLRHDANRRRRRALSARAGR
jgi:hypothetical protein